VIVSGVATGRPADAEEVRAASAATGIATLVGSGVTVENMASFDAADALIVGSSVKEGGVWSGRLDEARAVAICRTFRG
jgi:predicted TIM-barrel enzyme